MPSPAAGTNYGYWRLKFNTAFDLTKLDAIFFWQRQVRKSSCCRLRAQSLPAAILTSSLATKGQHLCSNAMSCLLHLSAMASQPLLNATVCTFCLNAATAIAALEALRKQHCRDTLQADTAVCRQQQPAGRHHLGICTGLGRLQLTARIDHHQPKAEAQHRLHH